MANDSVIFLMVAFQILNIVMFTGKYGSKFLEKKSRLLFLFLPVIVIVSLMYRPL
jgi:hypothetical protein